MGYAFTVGVTCRTEAEAAALLALIQTRIAEHATAVCFTATPIEKTVLSAQVLRDADALGWPVRVGAPWHPESTHPGHFIGTIQILGPETLRVVDTRTRDTHDIYPDEIEEFLENDDPRI